MDELKTYYRQKFDPKKIMAAPVVKHGRVPPEPKPGTTEYREKYPQNLKDVPYSTEAEIAALYEGNVAPMTDETLFGEFIEIEVPDLRALANAPQAKKDAFFQKMTDQVRGWSLPPERTQHMLRDALSLEVDPRDCISEDSLNLAGVQKKISDNAAKKMKKRDTDYTAVICRSYKDDGKPEVAADANPMTEDIRKVWAAKQAAGTLVPSGLPLYMDSIMVGKSLAIEEELMGYCALAGLRYKVSQQQLADRAEGIKRQCHKIMADLDELVANYNQLGWEG